MSSDTTKYLCSTGRVVPSSMGRVLPSTTASSGDQDLREKILYEIENKSKSCSNQTYECSIPRVDGYDYCMRHILQGARGNFRQCTFIYPNNKKCPNAVPKHDIKKDPAVTTFCFEHSRKTQLQKTRSTIGKLRRIETNDICLNNLSHHIVIDGSPERKEICEQEEEIDVVSPQVSPFINHDHLSTISSVVNTVRKRRRILDYASDSSCDENEPKTLFNTTRGLDFDESDDDSVDSHSEDCLKHAGVYTRQEAIRISESKLVKLQSLFIDEINRLHHVLKERRRRYLHEIRKERETHCSIHDQLKQTTGEMNLYQQLKALNSYHRRHGAEAVLYKKFKEKRARMVDTHSHKTASFVKCTFTEGGVRCGERSLPSSKYCRKHILEDKKQILFRACGVERSGVVCKEPIPTIFDDSTCVLHLPIPTKRQFIHKKYESETEEEDNDQKKYNDLSKNVKHTSTERKNVSAVVKLKETSTKAKYSAPDADDKNVTIFHGDSSKTKSGNVLKSVVSPTSSKKHEQ